MKYLLLLLALLAFSVSARAQTAGDPSVAQIEAVMGPQTQVERNGPGDYTIDHDHVTLQQLLTGMLPTKENALRAMQENIKQRQAITAQLASGMSIEAKRTHCQKLAPNSIDRTSCYQELEDLRDQQTQSSEEIADRQKDDDLQSDRLQQEIGAIEQFRKEFAAGAGK